MRAHATTAPITGPAIHALDGSACWELVTSVEMAVVAVADGPETEAVFLATDLVLVTSEAVVVVV